MSAASDSDHTPSGLSKAESVNSGPRTYKTPGVNSMEIEGSHQSPSSYGNLETTQVKRGVLEERKIHEEFAVKSKMIDVEGKVQTMWEDLLYSCAHSHPADVMPILGWFPKFLKNSPMRCILKDIICGVTITAIVVPQGMAYGMLASLPPVNGLYTAMLPTIGYTVFGTCMHLSIGPFALISMLTAEGIVELVDDPENNPEDAVEAARQIAFFSACMLMLLGILRLGFIGTFLSDPVLSGFPLSASSLSSGLHGTTFACVVASCFGSLVIPALPTSSPS